MPLFFASVSFRRGFLSRLPNLGSQPPKAAYSEFCKRLSFSGMFQAKHMRRAYFDGRRTMTEGDLGCVYSLLWYVSKTGPSTLVGVSSRTSVPVLLLLVPLLVSVLLFYQNPRKMLSVVWFRVSLLRSIRIAWVLGPSSPSGVVNCLPGLLFGLNSFFLKSCSCSVISLVVQVVLESRSEGSWSSQKGMASP